MDAAIDEIKKKLDVVEYVGRFVELKRSGRNFRGLCPFHQEKTPSFFVSPDRQTWRCFGACQTGGDVIAFLMKWESITFYEALRELSQETGVKIDSLGTEDRAWKEKEKLVTIHNHAMKFYNYILTTHPSGQHARDYLKERKINEKIIQTFQLGYSPSNWDSLGAYLKKKKYTPEDLVQAGLQIKSTKGTYYDRFRNRIMFPIIDSRDFTIAFSGRTLQKDTKEAKYVNSPETALYHKRETLFGLNLAKEAIRAEKKVILVEGEFDMISSFMHGISNVAAIKGSIVTKEQLVLLKKYTDHIILSLDADFSGTETTLRAIRDAEEMDMRIDIVTFDFAKDPDEALGKDPIAFKKLIENPIPFYDFVIDTAAKRHNTEDAFEKKKVAEEVVPFISNMENPIIKSHYIKKIANLLSTDESAVSSIMREYVLKQRKKVRRVQKQPMEEKDKFEAMQKTVLACIIQYEEPEKAFREAAIVISADDFSIPSYKELFTIVELMVENQGENFVKELINKVQPPLLDVLDVILLTDTSRLLDAKDTTNIKKIALHMKRLSIKSSIKGSMQKDGVGDEHIAAMSKRLAEVEKELSLL